MSVSIPEKEFIFPKYYTCCCCVLLRVVAQSLKPVKRFAANNTGSRCVRLQVALEENFNLVLATSLYRFAQLVLFHVEKTFKKNLWDKGIQQATSKTLKLNQLIFPNYFAILLLVPFLFRLNVPPLTHTTLHIM